jgi:hypothetical protein
VRWNVAIKRRTTGLLEPYLSYVLPVTVPSESRVTVVALVLLAAEGEE